MCKSTSSKSPSPAWEEISEAEVETGLDKIHASSRGKAADQCCLPRWQDLALASIKDRLSFPFLFLSAILHHARFLPGKKFSVFSRIIGEKRLVISKSEKSIVFVGPFEVLHGYPPRRSLSRDHVRTTSALSRRGPLRDSTEDRRIGLNMNYSIFFTEIGNECLLAVPDPGGGNRGGGQLNPPPPPEDAPKFNFYFNFSNKFC